MSLQSFKVIPFHTRKIVDIVYYINKSTFTKMKKFLFLSAFAMTVLAWTSCSKSAQTTKTQGEEAVIEEVAAEETLSNEAYYDEVLDMYENAFKNNDFEVISATTENLAEAEMEGLLTPVQLERWHKLNQ